MLSSSIVCTDFLVIESRQPEMWCTHFNADTRLRCNMKKFRFCSMVRPNMYYESIPAISFLTSIDHATRPRQCVCMEAVSATSLLVVAVVANPLCVVSCECLSIRMSDFASLAASAIPSTEEMSENLLIARAQLCLDKADKHRPVDVSKPVDHQICFTCLYFQEADSLTRIPPYTDPHAQWQLLVQ